MRSFGPILLALATSSTTKAIALPATDSQPAIPELPEGFFAGYNNPDGTSTLQFIDSNSNITFTPTSAPTSSTASGLQARQGTGGDTPTWSCWPGTLDRNGVDQGIRKLRERLQSSPIGIGQWSDWPPYFGYNNNGAYVYVCENTGYSWNSYGYTREDLDHQSYWMDQKCGAYVPGYFSGSAGILFGKARSGTAVCQGNGRSPR
ncbi:hypothetical protein CFE70_007981 [Pyrenophora teres f. teres 0-1]|uniref:Uncharacterized protein n=1 Tax=Pyrenophora teres f. teres (strain 0-1) TaxID=861557 RepID=E3RH62_PYRTT|nr:hypothetical protein PTT_07221 [Pyrenophora teres f. teres 0-1]KAK1914359.1 hypothetical protein P3342_010347 [Pyrenophora teres f. teres]CAA9964972.1 hypothetical protein PTMSG1_08331 [Pyrenophora teres f. maculata]